MRTKLSTIDRLRDKWEMDKKNARKRGLPEPPAPPELDPKPAEPLAEPLAEPPAEPSAGTPAWRGLRRHADMDAAAASTGFELPDNWPGLTLAEKETTLDDLAT